MHSAEEPPEIHVSDNTNNKENNTHSDTHALAHNDTFSGDSDHTDTDVRVRAHDTLAHTLTSSSVSWCTQRVHSTIPLIYLTLTCLLSIQVIGMHVALVYAQGLMLTGLSIYTVTMLTFASPLLLLVRRRVTVRAIRYLLVVCSALLVLFRALCVHVSQPGSVLFAAVCVCVLCVCQCDVCV